MPVTIMLHPKPLADALSNAVAVSKELASVPSCPNIMITATGGSLYVYGVGRYAGGRTRVPTDMAVAGEETVTITREQAEGLATALRKVLGGQAASVGVTMDAAHFPVVVKDEHGMPVQQWANFHVATGDEPLAAFMEADPDDVWGWQFDVVDDVHADQPGVVPTPVAFTLDIMARFSKLKGAGKVIDMRTTKQPQLLAVAVGPDFRGVVAAVDRELYKVGGPGGDGPGSPDHLF